MDYQAVFQRKEKKYPICQSMCPDLQAQLSPFMELDKHGFYGVSSIYFDTDHYDLIRASVQKPLFKEKLRLRCYGRPSSDSPVFLELKKKYDGVVYKRRISLPLGEAEDFLLSQGHIRERSQIAEEIEWFVARHRPSPKLMLSCDRIALRGRDDPRLRLTFDQNILWRREDLDLSKGAYGTPLLPEGRAMMEIKSLGPFPLWLSALLSENKLYPCPFSKYGSWYQTHFLPREVERHVG
jgi:hypothetical protein